MEQLNLPTYEYKIKHEGDCSYIFDSIRKKYILLTPEEWVRQHFIHLLINHYHYPKSLISCESGFTMNGLGKRTDIVVYTNKMEVFLLVECKAPQVTVGESTLRQACVYNRKLKARYIALSNGLKTFCFDIHPDGASQLQDIPDYHSLT